jgi:hypothetical protein
MPRDGLSNLELVANSTWIIALARLKCPSCGFVSSDIRLTALNTPCPRCGSCGKAREVFPGMLAVRWLEIVGECYVKAFAGAGKRQAALAEEARAILGRAPERSWLEGALRTLRRLARKHYVSPADSRERLRAFKKRLALRSQEESDRLWYLLATYRDTTNDHTGVVVATASLFEELLRELLTGVLVCKGEPYLKARDAVSMVRSRAQATALFKKLTGVSLSRAVREFPVPGLFDAWQEAARKRNDYVHITPSAVGAEASERAFNAAKNAFGLFSFLHNQYSLAPPRTRQVSGSSRWPVAKSFVF